MSNAPTISICTLGCRVNAYESMVIADSARAKGFKVVEWGENADFGVVNSCALTVLAQAKTRQAIRIFARKNPDSQIAVTGCYAQTAPDEIAKLPNVKIIAGNAKKANVIELLLACDSLRSTQIRAFEHLALDANVALSSRGFIDERVNLKIQDGCDNCCSYCIIPRARGLPRSRSFAEILSDARNLVLRGAREIVITGINITKFSTSEGGLVEIVDALDSIPELSRIRIGSIEPQDMPVEPLLARAADPSHKLQPHFHVSAQSLCDRVLQAMRRKNSVREFLDFAARSKEVCPDISIGADLICGHPFERDCDYEQTKSNLLQSGLTYAHIFTFSPRPKTLAATMSADTPPPDVRKARADDLRIAAANLHREFMRSQCGKIRPILLEKRFPNGLYLAHTDNYIELAVTGLPDGLKNTLAAARLDKVVGSKKIFATAINLPSSAK